MCRLMARLKAVPFPFVVVPEIKIAANFRAPDAVVVTRKSIHDLAWEGRDFSRADRAAKGDGFSR